MNWPSTIKGFNAYLKLEKGLSKNTILAYLRDVEKLRDFYLDYPEKVLPSSLDQGKLEDFIHTLGDSKIALRSQARILSSIRAFCRFLIIETILNHDPSALLEGPKLSRKIPEYLSIDEIEQIISAIDLSEIHGQRDRAIIEILYGCGLRVSELINLKISNLNFDIDFIKVIGKGNKERLVPINPSAIKQTELYLNHARPSIEVATEFVDFVFLNHRKKPLSRVAIFNLTKKLADAAGITKNISPHTFRHSFATHLYEGGADLKVIQDLLGHKSITTTEIYSHVNQKYLHETLRKFHPRFKI